jgi:Apoptosis regulator proteins, Bcl-2 family
MHQKIYTNIARQVTSGPLNSLDDPEETVIMLGTIGKLLFKNEVTWGKIISIFCVTGGLSIDLVRANQEQHLPKLIDGFCGVVEDELLNFLSCETSGWLGLHYKLIDRQKSELTSLICSIILISIIILFFLINNYLLKSW